MHYTTGIVRFSAINTDFNLKNGTKGRFKYTNEDSFKGNRDIFQFVRRIS